MLTKELDTLNLEPKHSASWVYVVHTWPQALAFQAWVFGYLVLVVPCDVAAACVLDPASQKAELPVALMPLQAPYPQQQVGRARLAAELATAL